MPMPSPFADSRILLFDEDINDPRLMLALSQGSSSAFFFAALSSANAETQGIARKTVTIAKSTNLLTRPSFGICYFACTLGLLAIIDAWRSEITNQNAYNILELDLLHRDFRYILVSQKVIKYDYLSHPGAQHIVKPALDVDQTGRRGYKTRAINVRNN